MKMRSMVAIAAVLVLGAGLYVWHAESSGDETTATPLAEIPAPAPLPLPPPAAEKFKDTSMLRAPAGVKVAIYEFDDLECPVCARAVPTLHAAAEHYGIPLIHHDYPLTEIHVWSFDAAVTARYLQDKVSPDAAEAYRRDLFAHQADISTKEDLERFTKGWFQANGQAMPFVMDENGSCSNEVKADRALGDRIGVGQHGTPCIFVVTQTGWTLVPTIDQLTQAIDAAMAQTAASVETARTEERKA